MKKTKKDQIIDKASELFWQQGIQATSMDDIAAEVPVAKMTIYKYFGSKDNLVSAVMDRYIRSQHAHMTDIIQSAPDPLTAMRNFMTYQEADIPKLFIQECVEFYPQVTAASLHYYAEHIATEFEQLVFAGQQQGQIRKDISPHLVLLYVQAIKEYFSNAANLKRMGDMKLASEQFITMFMYGIVTKDNQPNS